MLTPVYYTRKVCLRLGEPPHTNGKCIPPVASNLLCLWSVRLNFLGSNDQKQSVVRR